MNIFKRLIYNIQEWRGLRRCDTLAEWESYAKVLKTPERIAYWVANSIFYEDEKPSTWFPIEKALKEKKGNCTEISGIEVHGLRQLQGYTAEILCVFGKDEDYNSAGHAVCAFNDGCHRGIIEGSKVTRYKPFAPWSLVAIEVRPEWKALVWEWRTIEGKKIAIVGI